MAAPKVMSGARAKVAIVDPQTDEATVVGIFNQCSYGLTFDQQPVYILGRYSAAEIEYTGQEVVGITCSGWRVVGNGPHNLGKDGAKAGVPNLFDLLTHEYIELTVIDRQTESSDPNKARIAKFRKVRPTGYSTTISAKQLEDITISFVGILVDDENTTNTETPNAANLP